MKTLVIGLGNPILTDDGVGVKVAYAVDDALASGGRNGVTVSEASVGGLRLMEMMEQKFGLFLLKRVPVEALPQLLISTGMEL